MLINPTTQISPNELTTPVNVNKHLNLFECQEKARKIDIFYKKFEEVVDMVDSAKECFNSIVSSYMEEIDQRGIRKEVRDILNDYEKLRTKVFHFLLNFRKTKHQDKSPDEISPVDQSQTSYTSKTLSSDIFKNIMMEMVPSHKRRQGALKQTTSNNHRQRSRANNAPNTHQAGGNVTMSSLNQQHSAMNSNVNGVSYTGNGPTQKKNKMRSYMRLHKNEERFTYKSERADLSNLYSSEYTGKGGISSERMKSMKPGTKNPEEMKNDLIGIKIFMENKLKAQEKINDLDLEFSKLVFKTTKDSSIPSDNLNEPKPGRTIGASKSRDLKKVKNKVRSLSPNSFKIFQRQGLYQNPLIRANNNGDIAREAKKQRYKGITGRNSGGEGPVYNGGGRARQLYPHQKQLREKSQRKRDKKRHGNNHTYNSSKANGSKAELITKGRRLTFEEKHTTSYYYNYLQRKKDKKEAEKKAAATKQNSFGNTNSDHGASRMMFSTSLKPFKSNQASKMI